MNTKNALRKIINTTGRLAAASMLVLLAAAALAAPAQAVETITYYHLDALGSPVAATDEQGNVKWREEYKPYGERIKQEAGAQANSRWYTGHPHDEATGLTYMGARYYDPVVGRFMAIDPVAFTEKNIHSFNRYGYANDNPYRFIDPDGREPVGKVISLFYKGGEKFVRWVSSKAEAVQARKLGEDVKMQTRQQAKQVAEALAGGDKSKVWRDKGHVLRDGSTGGPHYHTEGKKGHTFWGKLGVGGAAVGVGVGASDDAEAGTEPEPHKDGGSLVDIVNLALDLVVPGGLNEVTPEMRHFDDTPGAVWPSK